MFRLKLKISIKVIRYTLNWLKYFGREFKGIKIYSEWIWECLG